MGLRAHRRNPTGWGGKRMLWSLSGSADVAPRLTGTRRIRRFIRIGTLLTMIGLMRLARGVRPRWRPLLAGVVLTAAGIALRSGLLSVVAIPGMMLLWYTVNIPGGPDADHKRRSQLERELATYSTPAQRCDLAATFDRYPDDVTYELREVLAGQARPAGKSRIPGAGRC
jgi:hypothetical protein